MNNEYAIIGSRTKVHFLDVTNPTSPVLKAEFVGGANSPWRDFKTFDHYAYGVADSGNEGLMIFDLTALPSGSITLASQSNNDFGRAHNIYIDAPNERMYVVGSDTRGNGVIIYSLADPLNPSIIADINMTGGYIHDIFVQGNIAYASHGFNGMYIYDMTTPTNPVLLANINTGNFNHSSWITENGSHLIYAEEVPSGLPMGMIDLSGIAQSNLSITSTFSFPLLAPNHTNVTYHNPYIIGDYAIVSSYLDGVIIVDISNPSNPQLAGWFDTFPTNTNYNGGSGCWGVYPYFPSGNIIASDISNGLFVLGTTINITTECNNGVMDEFETGIDCGGFCAPCNNSLTVDFQADVVTGLAPLTVNFTELANNETSYQWDFDNDGTTDDTSPNPSFTFTSEGTYTVSLTVSDAGGSMETETKDAYITVLNFTCYEDLDGDGFGSSVEVAPVEFQCLSGSVLNNTDCDDDNPDDTNINADGNPVQAGTYFAHATVTSKSPVIVGTVGVDNVTFQAGIEVILTTGFLAAVGSDFHGLIDPNCPVPPSEEFQGEMDEVIFYQEEKNNEGLDGLKIYPNPLQQNATFEYTLGQASSVNLFIRDSQGRVVKELINNAFTEEGIYQFSFDAGRLPPSVYYLFLQTENGNIAQRMVLLKG